MTKMVTVRLLLLATAALTAAQLHGQETKPPVKREGTFLLQGTLVDPAKTPLTGWTVMVRDSGEERRSDPRYSDARFPQLQDERFALAENGNLIYRGYAGQGVTGPDGRFQVVVSKAYFKGREIAFRLSAMTQEKGVHEPVQTKQTGGAEAVFKADEAAKTVDLLKLAGRPIVCKAASKYSLACWLD